MSWRDAPLYVRCHSLAADLLTRVDAAPGAPWPVLRRVLAQDTLSLLGAVSLALSFPVGRAEALIAADQAVVALKVNLRLSAELGVLSEGGARQAGEELVAIGRMIGGWRRRKPGPPAKKTSTIGAEPTLSPTA